MGWGRGLGQASTGGSPQPSQLLVLLGQSGRRPRAGVLGSPLPPGRATPDVGTGPGQGQGAWRWWWARRRCGAAGLLSAASRWHARSGNCAAEQRQLCTEPSLQLLSCSASCSPVLHLVLPLFPQPHPAAPSRLWGRGTVQCWWPNTAIIRTDESQPRSLALSAWCTRSWVALPVAAPVPGHQLTATFPPAPASVPRQRRAAACPACSSTGSPSGRAGR